MVALFSSILFVLNSLSFLSDGSDIGGLALVSDYWAMYIGFIGDSDGFCESFGGLWVARFCGSLDFLVGRRLFSGFGLISIS